MTLILDRAQSIFITGNKPFSIYSVSFSGDSTNLFIYTKSEEELKILMEFFQEFDIEELPIWRTDGIEEVRKERLWFFPEKIDVDELFVGFYWCFFLKVRDIIKINEKVNQLSNLDFKKVIKINETTAVVL